MAARVLSECGCGRTFRHPAAHAHHAIVIGCPLAQQRPQWADEPPADTYSLARAQADQTAADEQAWRDRQVAS